MIAPDWRASRVFLHATALLALAVSATTAFAQTNLLQNGSFESSYFNDSLSTSQGIGFVGALPNGSSGYATIPSWTSTPGAYSPSTFALNKTGGNLGVTAQDGSYSVSFGTGSYQSGGSISQSFTATSGAHCTLSFWVRRIGGGEGIGAKVEVLNGASEVALTDSANASYSSGYTVPIPSTSNVWSQVTLKFTAPSSNLTFKFTDTTGQNAAGSTDLGLDNVSITQKTLQTITFYGGVGNQGDIAANTEYSNDGDVSWHPAYLSGAHPWGFLPGTSSWINQDPSPFVGLYQTTDFRIKFNLPSEFEGGSMSFQVNADNHGELFINTTSLSSTDGGYTPSLITADGSSLLPGQVNILKIRLTDYGGWVGINYVLTLTGYAYSAPTVVVLAPVITNSLSASGTVGTPFSFQLTGGNTPTSFGAANLPPGLSINTSTGVISGTPTTYGTYSSAFSETNSGGTTNGTLTITINKGAAAVTLGGLSQVYDGSVKSATATTNPGNLTVSFSYTGAALPPINAGIYGVLGAVSDANYSGSASGNMTISPASLAITLGNLTQTYTGSGRSASVTTSPSSVSTTVTYNGNSTLPINVGNYTVAASSANSNYTGSKTGTLTITPAALSIAFGNLSQTYNGSTHPVTVTTTPSGIATATVTYAGSTTAPTNAGNYTVATSSANANYAGNATATLTVAPQPTTITVGNTVQSYDGTPKSVSTTTSPTSNVPVTVSYNGSTAAPSAVGNYTVSVATNNPNYAGTATATLQIKDTTAPVLQLPQPISVNATSASGAAVSFSATATDDVDGAVPVALSTASGSVFAPGVTTVTATATDAAGNKATGIFTVTVHYISLTEDKSSLAIPQGGTAANSGTFSEITGAAVTLSASKGNLTQTGSGQWTFQQMLSPGGNPIELVLDTQENLYVVSQTEVVKYDAAGNLVTRWAVAGTPTGIAIDTANSWLYVVSRDGMIVRKYDLNGSLLTSWGTPGSGNGQFNTPHCVAVDASGTVYVTDSFNSRVQVFDSNGNYQRQWGSGGSAAGQFNFPQGIRITPSGTVYIADRGNNRVQYFKTDGTYLGQWGSGGTGNGQFNSPAGVGIDPSGNVYVGDINNNRVQKFTATGTYLDQVGPGSGDGTLSMPHGTVFPPAGRSVYIASWNNGHVVKYLTPGAWSWNYTASPTEIGTSTVTVTATGANGLTATTSFDLTIKDATPPTITVPANIITEATSAAGAVVNFSASASDNVDGAITPAFSQAPGTTFPIGSTLVTVSAKDAAGNSASKTFTVTVRDTTAPSITVPANIVAEATSAAGTAVSFTASATDLVDGTVAVSSSRASGSTFALGTTTVTLTSTDAHGNTSHATFAVTVRDTTAPVIATHENILTEATDARGAAVTFNASASDLVSGAVAVTASPASGSIFPLGTSTVALSAVDGANNTATSSFTVTVRDTTAPALQLPVNQVLEATGATGAVASFAASATDAVTASPAISYSIASGSTFAIGTTTVNVTATDEAGNVSSGSFTITVQDTTAPTITAPANQVIEATGATGAIATFSASATDIVDGAIAVTSDIASGSTFPLGTTPVTLTATDAHGNVSHAVFSITVQDTTAPVIAAQDNLIVEATGADGAVVSFTPSASDIVDGGVAVAASPKSGSTFPIGTTTVTLAASDAAGNTATGSFTVTVRDTTPPVISGPGNIVTEATSAAGAVVTFNASANDIVDGAVTVTAVPASGSTFALGISTVTLTSTDAHGNTSTSTFTVTVRDTTAPKLAVPSNLTLEATSAAGAVATFAASATDAVTASPVIGYSVASGSTFALGTTTVNVTATDAAGNVSKGSFTVTVVDTTAPAPTVPANQTLEATSAAGAVATYAASATDVVTASPTIAYSVAPGSTFALGATTVNVSATDAAGNVSKGSFTVTVRDTTAPKLTVPANLTLEATSAAGAVANFAASATDIVTASPAITYSIAPGSTFAIGTTTVNVTAADAAGNKSTGSFTVTVRDTTAPTFTSLTASPNSIWPPNKKMVAVTITPNIADNVGATSVKIVSVTTNEPDGTTQWSITGDLTLTLKADRLGTGTGRVYTITVEARDAAGNATRKTVTVTVPHDQGN